MEDEQGLLAKAQAFESRIAAAANNNENILIASHHDADGLCASTILSDFVFKKKGHCQIRTTSEPNSKFLDRVATAGFDLLIFVDICSGLSQEISKRFGDKWLIIDHHEIPESELEHERILNCYQFGFDGTTSLSSSGLAYLVARNSRERFAFLSIVGALSDMQDVGQRRSLVGYNAKILETDSKEFKDIDSKFDLLFTSRETKPVHESISSTMSVYIPGLTGNKDACLASLRGSGMEIKTNARWKSISDFSEDEKHQLLESIIPHLTGTTYTVEDLVGNVYSLNSRDEYSLKHDARDFAAMLNMCGRLGKPGLALSLCLGEEGLISNEIESVISEYRLEIMKSVQLLLQSEDRITEKGEFALVVGDGVVKERMTGAICQILSALGRFRGKVVFLRTTTQEGDLKVSARCGKDVADCDLGAMLMRVAKATSGIGGGMKNAAGAKFSIAKQQEFQQVVDSLFQNRKSR